MAQIQKLLIVTGFSGAGMSSTLKHLEDLGYEVLDNFPLPLLDALLQNEHFQNKAIAIGIDARTQGFDTQKILKEAKKASASLLFLACDHEELQKRFSETRRRHPMAKDRSTNEGIIKEIKLLKTLQAQADAVIDTTKLSVHDLKRAIEARFKLEHHGALVVNVLSFGFKNGAPREADIMMDVRFLKNPHWDKDLRPYTGLDQIIADYVEGDDAFDPFIEKFQDLLKLLLPRYDHEGKSYLTIAIGCTGGKHRSVYTARKMAGWIEQEGYLTNIHHRDIPLKT